MVLLLDDTSSGAPIELEERKGRSYEKWEVVGYF
jgi:hypothetical protein